jgi:hypothetical protein
MSRMTNPDNDMLIAQQERDLGHAERSQPDAARSREGETPEERIEADIFSNKGIGLAVEPGRRKSETEKALERARGKAREQESLGRRRSGS